MTFTSLIIYIFLGDGKYRIVADPRMADPLFPLHDINYLQQILKIYPITCPYLLIMCKKSSVMSFAEPVIEEYKKWKNFHFHLVDAEHDVHIAYPQLIAPRITTFLTLSEAKL